MQNYMKKGVNKRFTPFFLCLFIYFHYFCIELYTGIPQIRKRIRYKIRILFIFNLLCTLLFLISACVLAIVHIS